MKTKYLFFIAALFASSTVLLSAQPVRVNAEAETGFVKVFMHTYRLGAVADGSSTFDFVNQGGQEILYPFSRFTVETVLADSHLFRFLYQPLEISTTVPFRSDVTLDGILFPAGTPMGITYSFPFYRMTYLFRILDGAFSLDAGLAVQLRNASIRFERLDGEPGLSVSQNLGVVPALAVAAAWNPSETLSLGFDATGIYASSAFINGANFSFEGSLLDASLRASARLTEGVWPYLNLRFLGGSASGVSGFDRSAWSESLSPETENRLVTATASAGVRLEASAFGSK